MPNRSLVDLRPLRRDVRPAAGPPEPPPVGDLPASAPVDRAALRQEVTRDLAAVLYTDPAGLDVHAPFTDLGVDSVLGVEFARGLQNRHAVSFPSGALYEHTTIAQVSEYLADLLSGREVDGREPAGPPTTVSGAAPAEVLATVRRLLGAVLYSDPDDIDPETEFAALGLDSVLGVQFVDRLNRELDVECRAVLLYELPTPAALTAWLCDGPSGGAIGAAVPESPARHAATTSPTGPPAPEPPTATDLSELLAGVLDNRLSADQAAGRLPAPPPARPVTRFPEGPRA